MFWCRVSSIQDFWQSGIDSTHERVYHNWQGYYSAWERASSCPPRYSTRHSAKEWVLSFSRLFRLWILTTSFSVIEREIVRSTIPIHEVRHEAPIIHQSEAHSPVTMDHFRDHNGILTNALSVDKVGDMLLRRSPCSRTAEGPETDVEREIKDNDVGLYSFLWLTYSKL